MRRMWHSGARWLSALMLGKRKDPAPYTTAALGEVPALPWHPKVWDLHEEISKI